jgi:hypothetical protein
MHLLYLCGDEKEKGLATDSQTREDLFEGTTYPMGESCASGHIDENVVGRGDGV